MAKRQIAFDENNAREYLPSNSMLAKKSVDRDSTERPKVEKVISSKPVVKKKGIGKKFADTFLGDNINSVKEYVLFDVLIPAAKSTISDMVSQGLEMLLFGETRSRSKSSSGKNGYVSYSSYYEKKNKPERNIVRPNRRALHEFDDIILETRSDAELVMDKMCEILEIYDYVTVGDLYDAVDLESDYTDRSWGWDNLSTASIRRVRNGYLLELPSPKVID